MAVVVGLSFMAVTAGDAEAASFDCKKAKTKVEKLVCETPELSKADDELGRLYKAARKAAKTGAEALQRAQSAWLKHIRNDCGDTACLLAAYERRNAELAATAKPSGRTGSYAGIMANGEDTLEVIEVAAGRLRFQLTMLGGRGEDLSAGLLCGEVTIKDGKGTYAADECELKWAFAKGKRSKVKIEQEGDCGLGNVVTAAGDYQREATEAPSLSQCYEEDRSW